MNTRLNMLTSMLALAALLLSMGCDSQNANSEPPDQPPAARAEEAKAPEANAADDSADKPGGGEALATFEQMDARKPVPLTPMMANHQLENMRDHLLAVQQIIEAAAEEDFEGINKAAQKIGSSPQMAQMCNHMGAGADGFTELALGFHETADGIIEAAEEEDYGAVMSALGDTLNTCNSCHAQFKQQVVSEEAWSQKTGMGVGGGTQQMHHGGDHH